MNQLWRIALIITVGLGLLGRTTARAQTCTNENAIYHAGPIEVTMQVELRDARTGQVLSTSSAPIGVISAFSCTNAADLETALSNAADQTRAEFVKNRLP